MKKLFLLFIFAVGLFTSTTTFGQGTKTQPWPGSTYDYSITASGVGTLSYEWWVATASTSVDASDAISQYTINSGQSTNSVNITWGNDVFSAHSGATLYLIVKVGDANLSGDICYNYKALPITPQNNINLAAFDITGASSQTTTNLSDNNSGNHCPEFADFIAEEGSYNPGKTVLKFRVDRQFSNVGWEFDYTLTGVTVSSVTVSSGTESSGTVSAIPSANDYVILTFKVVNTPGSGQSAVFTITRAIDANNASETDTSDNARTHEIKSMPQIGAFN